DGVAMGRDAVARGVDPVVVDHAYAGQGAAHKQPHVDAVGVGGINRRDVPEQGNEPRLGRLAERFGSFVIAHRHRHGPAVDDPVQAKQRGAAVDCRRGLAPRVDVEQAAQQQPLAAMAVGTGGDGRDSDQRPGQHHLHRPRHESSRSRLRNSPPTNSIAPWWRDTLETLYSNTYTRLRRTRPPSLTRAKVPKLTEPSRNCTLAVEQYSRAMRLASSRIFRFDQVNQARATAPRMSRNSRGDTGRILAFARTGKSPPPSRAAVDARGDVRGFSSAGIPAHGRSAHRHGAESMNIQRR